MTGRKLIYDEKCVAHEFKVNVIDEKSSKYQTITIAEHPCYGKMLLLDNLIQFSTSDEHIFHEMMAYPLLSLKKIKNVVVLGGGDGFLAYLLAEKGIKVDVVELDVEVAKMCKKYFYKSKKAFTKNSKVNLIIGDALEYKSEKKYDAVFVDLVDYYSMPSLYSKKSLEKFKNLGDYFMFHSDYTTFNKMEASLKKSFKNLITFSAYIPSYFSLWTFTIASDKKINKEKIKSSKLKGKYFSKERIWEYEKIPFKYKGHEVK